MSTIKQYLLMISFLTVASCSIVEMVHAERYRRDYYDNDYDYDDGDGYYEYYDDGGDRVRGALGGAATGAIIGGVAGGGRGAGIGAGVGALLGGSGIL